MGEGAELISQALDQPVSRETSARLQTYAELLVRWQKAVNLVGPKTLPDLWRRHMLDSAQLFPRIPQGAQSLMDLGSGAGFPGLVLAILALERPTPLAVTLVESDLKKATFLREVARETGVKVLVEARRIEALPAHTVDIITARALAPLKDLLAWSQAFWSDGTIGLFLKGEDFNSELTQAREFANIDVQSWPSLSDARGIVLQVQRRVV